MLELWDITGSPGRLCVRDRCVSGHCLHAGDAFFVLNIRKSQYKSWINELLIPYMVLFSCSSLASAVSLVVKLHAFGFQIQQRKAARRAVQQQAAATLSTAERVAEVQNKIGENDVQLRLMCVPARMHLRCLWGHHVLALPRNIIVQVLRHKSTSLRRCAHG